MAQPAPPRTIRDIVDMLERHAPNPAAVQRAQGVFDRAPPATEDKRTLIEYWLARARAAEALGLSGDELEARRKARDLARDTGSYQQILKDAAARELAYGNYAEAIRLYEEIVRTNTRPGPLQGAYGSLAVYYADLGDPVNAKAMLERSEAKFNEVMWNLGGGQLAIWAPLHRYVLELHRGLVAANFGRLQEAEAALRRAMAANEEDFTVAELRLSMFGPAAPRLEANHATRSALRLQLASVLRQQGRLAEAELLLREALRTDLARVGRHAGTTARALNALARHYAEQGRFADAEALSRIALAGFEKAGLAPRSSNVQAARSTLVGALIGQERWEDALAEFDRIRQGAREGEVRHWAEKGNPSVAIALVRSGRGPEARRMMEPLVREAEERYGAASYAAGEARGALAAALAATGEPDAAAKAFAEALRLMQGARRQGDGDPAGGLRQLRLAWIAEAYLELLAQAHRAGAPDAAVEAFRVADIARGHRVEEALSAAAARSAAGTPELAALARKEQDLRNERAALSVLLTRMLARAPEQQLPKVMADMRARLEQLGAERLAAFRQIEKAFPAYAGLIHPRAPALGEVRRALRPGEALVAFYVAAQKSYAWAVPAEGPVAFAEVAAPRAQVAAWVDRLGRSVRLTGLRHRPVPDFDVGASVALFDALLRPVEQGWSAAPQLLVIAHGPLARIPFSLVATAAGERPQAGGLPFAEYRAVPWLVRQKAISHLPTASALVTLRALPPRAAARRAFAGFGDPVFSRDEERQLAAAASDPEARGPALRVRAVGASAQLDSVRLAQLPRLPDTADEIRGIAAALGAREEEDVFLRARANEKEVKSRDWSGTRVLAFATHGLTAGEIDGLEQPALALSAPDVAGIEGDGLLSMDEILALKLDADWVLLSACNTAAGERAGAEAVSGLGRAFFFAGARALLVSSWPVETESTRLLVTRTLEHYVKTPGTARAEALRRAMLDLIEREAARAPDGSPAYSYAHPLFWAPFSLHGEGGER
jgi:CHAT domain-containing protein